MMPVNMSKRNYKTRKHWTENQEDFLIKLWGKKINELKGHRRNFHIIKEIKFEMEKKNFMFTAEEIRIKMHNLTNRYKYEQTEKSV